MQSDTLILEHIYRKMFESMNSNISSSDIYNFYYATLLYQTKFSFLDQFGKFIVDETLRETKKLYLNNFRNIILSQLEKYQTRGRVDKSWDGVIIKDNSYTYGDMDKLMKATYRSDMVRRNDSWNQLTEYLSKLENSIRLQDIIFNVDRINNCIHNTQENILSKFDNGYELINAFEFAHKASTEELKTKVSKDLRNL